MNIKRFAKAVKEGNIENVKKCMLDNIRPKHLNYCLVESAKYGQHEIVKYILGHKNIRPKHLNYCLLESARSGYLEIVKYLVENCADYLQEDNTDKYDRAVVLSAENGHLDIVKYLVEHGSTSLDDALVSSAKNGHLPVVQYLVDECANIEQRDLLRYSAANGHLVVVKFLVEKEESIRASLNYGLMEGHTNYKIIKCLVDKCEDTFSQKEIALISSAKNGHLQVVKYFAEKGVDIHAYQNSALVSSAANGHLEVVKYLTEKGAVETNALIGSAKNGHLHVVKYFAEKGYDVNIGNNGALIRSAENGYVDVVKYLVDHSADVHAQNDKEITISAEHGHVDVLKYFLSIGIPIEKFSKLFSPKFVSNYFVSKFQAEDAEFIAQFFSNPVPNFVTTSFHEYAFKYGIVYEGSNYPPMDDEYKKRKETRSIIKNELYEKAQEILYRPGGIRAQLTERRFYQNAANTSNNEVNTIMKWTE